MTVATIHGSYLGEMVLDQNSYFTCSIATISAAGIVISTDLLLYVFPGVASGLVYYRITLTYNNNYCDCMPLPYAGFVFTRDGIGCTIEKGFTERITLFCGF